MLLKYEVTDIPMVDRYFDQEGMGSLGIWKLLRAGRLQPNGMEKVDRLEVSA